MEEDFIMGQLHDAGGDNDAISVAGSEEPDESAVARSLSFGTPTSDIAQSQVSISHNHRQTSRPTSHIYHSHRQTRKETRPTTHNHR